MTSLHTVAWPFGHFLWVKQIILCYGIGANDSADVLALQSAAYLYGGNINKQKETEGTEGKVLFCQGEPEFFCDVCLLRDVQSATNRLSDRSLNDV